MKRLIRRLSRYYVEICEGCDGLYFSIEGHTTDDDVTLCPKCWQCCLDEERELSVEA